MAFRGLDDDLKDSAATCITLRPQLGGRRQCGLVICTFHLGFSLGFWSGLSGTLGPDLFLTWRRNDGTQHTDGERRPVAGRAGRGISAIAFCYVGILWMTASGDPQKMGQARTAIFGAVGGLVIVGIAFMAPRIISEFVIEPAGGQVIAGDAGVSCDALLRSQLQVQRGASTAGRMNQVISQIQAQRDECPEDTWDPLVDDTGRLATSARAAQPASDGGTPLDTSDDTLAIPAAPASDGCFTLADVTGGGLVGDTVVPASLRNGNTSIVALGASDGDPGTIRANSGRDSENNIIIYWSPARG